MSDNIVDLEPKKANNVKNDISMNNKKKEDMPEKSSYDVRNISVPIAVIIAAISFAVWVTWEGAQVNTKIEKLGENVYSLTNTVDKIVEAIDPLKRGTTWTAQDQTIWCLRTQISNPNWKCPDQYLEQDRRVMLVPPALSPQ